MTATINPNITSYPPGTTWTIVTVQASRHTHHTPIPGEPTPVAGLVIVPDRARDHAAYTGLWSVRHVASGRHLTNAAPLAYCREAAAQLAALGIDWTLPADDLQAPPVRDVAYPVVFEIRERLDEAWEAGFPLWWARESFPPPDDRRQVRHTERAHGVYLACAAPLCRAHDYLPDQPARATAPDDDEFGGWFALDFLAKADAVRWATEHRWARGDDEHYLCPSCVFEHAPDPQPDIW